MRHSGPSVPHRQPRRLPRRLRSAAPCGQAGDDVAERRPTRAIHLCSHVGQAFRPVARTDLQGSKPCPT